ncbi:hypothetical protein SEVIR_1G003100v4 [Setaria viridis]|uniref:ferredoxin--NADP(+) reductase n=1 Tax=Setaria italica TaxID=4555 RepID=K3YUK4_SETIT
MAAMTAAAVSLSSSPAKANAAAALSPSSCSHFLAYPRRSAAGRAMRVQVSTTETAEAAAAPVKKAKISKKQDEGVVTNKYKPVEPYVGRCLLNTRITGDNAPGETWHMVFSTEGELPYREGQSIGVIADGVDKNGKPHKVRLYSIASSAIGDFGDSKTVSLCVKRLVYTNDQGEIVKGVCSNFLCDLKPGSEVKITGPVGKEMLMPKDPNATIIMVIEIALDRKRTDLIKHVLILMHIVIIICSSRRVPVSLPSAPSCGRCSSRSTTTTSTPGLLGCSWEFRQATPCCTRRSWRR